MHVLLTGSTGMVGRNLLDHFAANKISVSSPNRLDLDLRDPEAVINYIKKTNPDYVVHAAGKVGGIQANMREPANFLLENIQIGCNVINGARTAGVRKLINLGSSCMYPKGHDEALDESLLLSGQLEPTNEGYAIAKIAASKLCEYISLENPELNYKTIIPCNLYGRYDKFHPSESHLLPSIIRKIYMAKIKRSDTVEIWGDGNARREFMFAGDLADAIIYLLLYFDSAPTLMNIGMGYDFSVKDYYSIAAEVIGYDGKFSYDLEKPVGMQRKLLDISNQLEWGWKPKVDLREGIQQTYKYFCQNFSQ